MAISKPMTQQECLAVYREIEALKHAGKKEEAFELGYQIPLSPHMAIVIVKLLGKEWLRNSAWNLYEVEQALGKDWINEPADTRRRGWTLNELKKVYGKDRIKRPDDASRRAAKQRSLRVEYGR